MQPSLAVLKKRALIIQAVRNFFIKRRYLEVETPLLSPYLIPESCLEVFQTTWLRADHRPKELYLIPSPELWMKRIVLEAQENVFQLTKSFRNYESVSSAHNPEFTMLEYYTVNAGYMEAAQITEDLWASLDQVVPLKQELRPPFQRFSLYKAFYRYTKVDLELLTTREKMYEAACRLIGTALADDSWEVLFNKIFLSLVEPQLPRRRPVLLYDYPQGVSCLAEPRNPSASNPARPLKRWELYAGGLELANCFSELRDYRLLRDFLSEEERLKQTQLVPHPTDWEFLDLHKQEILPYSGVALGIDRLIMIVLELNSIDRQIIFPLQRIDD